MIFKNFNGMTKWIALLITIITLVISGATGWAYFRYHAEDKSIHHTIEELSQKFQPREISAIRFADVQKDLDEIQKRQEKMQETMERIESKLDRRAR